MDFLTFLFHQVKRLEEKVSSLQVKQKHVTSITVIGHLLWDVSEKPR